MKYETRGDVIKAIVTLCIDSQISTPASSSSNNSDILPPQSAALGGGDLVSVGRGVNGGTRLSEKMLIGTGQKVRGSR